MKKKIGISIGLVSLLIFAMIIFNSEHEMKYHHKTCAKFTRKYRGKSSYYYEFEYKAKGLTTHGIRDGFVMAEANEDSLKSFDCIEIIFSISNPKNIRITDKRVGNEWIDWD